MTFDPPGHADDLDPDLLAAWNETVKQNFEGISEPHSRFFELDPDQLKDAEVDDGVHWPGDPREPTFCLDAATVRTLCDWGERGRHVLQNEYCEYAVVTGTDSSGKQRPKRIEVTTELAEYWLCIAERDPDRVRALASEVLGVEAAWEDLYGVSDPHGLSPMERRVSFAKAVAGHGQQDDLQEAHVPANPTGRLNTERALFMSHPINGLDDLIFIVLFGAKHFAVPMADKKFRRAEVEDIFGGKLQALACRHADPTAALGAYDAVLNAKMVSFANPLGMYIRPFNQQILLFEDQPVPTEWIRWRRGTGTVHQRLEVGPSDEDDAFLDDIQIAVGQEPEPLVGGHQLISQLEVGPLLAVASTGAADPIEFKILTDGDPIDCRATGVCDEVTALKAEHDAK